MIFGKCHVSMNHMIATMKECRVYPTADKILAAMNEH